jgi:hypothetical protein
MIQPIKHGRSTNEHWDLIINKVDYVVLAFREIMDTKSCILMYTNLKNMFARLSY